ncbi:MAG: hypothetical protein IJ911_11015 [Salinivirgaceae bacterium]|nr:hypothetical protein [Salinivirgaceae bacterium]
MNLYIITSVLNIDNILSSESISPASFYRKRNYGYSHFEAIPNLKLPSDKIVLFDYLPYVEIIDSERINYPVVIEINKTELLSESKIEKEQDGIYLYGQTLYVNPFNCRLLFFSTEAYKETELRCLDSKTNKLYKYFGKSFVNRNEAKDISNIDFSAFIDKQNDIDELIKNDEILNSQKGFHLGWFLGSGKSITPDLAKLKSIERRAYDYVSAIRNNNGIITPAYRESLIKMDEQYKALDPNIKKAQMLWNERVNLFCSNRDAFEMFLKELNKESELKRAFSDSRKILLRRSFDIENFESFMTEMTNYTNVLLQTFQVSYSFYESTSCLYDAILTKLFYDKRFHLEDLRINRASVTHSFITEIKQFIENNGKDWVGSEAYMYLHSLMLNIIKSEPFDFNSIQDDLLKSVAAFLLKGEDYEEMMSFLLNNAMSEYRYVLGFWGAACGYTDMSRIITKPAFDDDKNVMENVYRHICKQVYGIELKGTIQLTDTILQENERIGSDTRSKNNNDSYINSSMTDDSTPRELLLIFENIDFKSFPPVAQKYYKEETRKLYNGKCDKTFLNQLKNLSKNCPVAKTTQKWKSCIKQANCSSNHSEQDGILFKPQDMYPIGQYFFNDKNVLYNIEDLIDNDKLKKKVNDEITWIQKAHQDGGYRKNGVWVKCNEKDNLNVISHFYNNAKNKIDSKTLELIVNKLKQLYHVY